MTEDVKNGTNGNGYSTKDAINLIFSELRSINEKIDRKADRDEVIDLAKKIQGTDIQLVELKTVRSQETKDQSVNRSQRNTFRIIWIPTISNIIVGLLLVWITWIQR
jgi:hypothetical protein